MKTNITLLSSLFALFLVGFSFSAKAQTQVTTADSVCAGTQDVVYGIASVPAASSLQWWLDDPTAGTIDLGISSNDDQIQIDWGTTSGTYSLYAVETTEFGCLGDTMELSITINELPSALVVSDSVCEGFDPTLTFTVTGEFPVTIDFTDGTTNYQTIASSSPHTHTITGAGYTTSQTIDITSVVDDNTCSEVTPVTGVNVTIHPAASTGQIYHY